MFGMFDDYNWDKMAVSMMGKGGHFVEPICWEETHHWEESMLIASWFDGFGAMLMTIIIMRYIYCVYALC